MRFAAQHDNFMKIKCLDPQYNITETTTRPLLSCPFFGCYLNRERGAGNDHSEQENETWEQSRELEMKLLIGLGFKVGFVPIFSFSRFSCPFSVLVTSVLFFLSLNITFKKLFTRVNTVVRAL